MSFSRNLDKASLLSPLYFEHFSKLDLSGITHIHANGFDNLLDETGDSIASLDNPLEEAKASFDSIDKSKEVVIIYGLGLGHLYTACKSWLQENPSRLLIFIEPDKRIIARFLESNQATPLIEDRQVKIFSILQEHGSLPIESRIQQMDYIAWSFWNKSYTIAISPYYGKKEPDLTTKLLKRLQSVIFDLQLNLRCQSGVMFKLAMNRILNAANPNPFFAIKEFKGKMEGVPAIICGAGSSLLKHIPYLKKLQDKALILAGGTSASVLTNLHIKPHMTAVIDPMPNLANQKVQTCFETPCLYSNRSGSDGIQLQDFLLLANDSPENGLDFWIHEHFTSFLDQDTSGFATVSDFLFTQACALGCNPIIFIGLDLSLTEDRYYADTTLSGAYYNKKEEKAIDIYGNPIYTKQDWIESSRRIAETAEKNPEKTILNATEGGIGVVGVPNVLFQDCIKKHLIHSFDPEMLLKNTLLSLNPHYADHAVMEKALEDFNKSLKACAALVHQMRHELTVLFLHWQAKTYEDLNPFDGELHNLQKKLDEEVAYVHLLQPAWKVLRKQSNNHYLDDPLKFRLSLFGMRSKEFDHYDTYIVTFGFLLEECQNHIQQLMACN